MRNVCPPPYHASPHHPQLELSQFCLFSYYKMLETNVGRMLESTDEVGRVGSLCSPLPLFLPPLPVSICMSWRLSMNIYHTIYLPKYCVIQHQLPDAINFLTSQRQ